MRIDIKNLTINKAHNLLINKDITVKDLVHAYLGEVDKNNKELNIFIEKYEDIEDQIKFAQEKIDKNNYTKLTGIPIAIKDNILKKGEISSSCSKMLENYVATYDSFVIKELKEEGVIFLGRTNMDEFAMGSSTESSVFGPTKNPADTTRVAGGSSGGSAAAVSANMALFSLGTETCGSVRQPSSFCGTVGLKPSYGSVSRSGVVAMGSSLDQIGPMAKTIDDIEIIFKSISKFDPDDSTSIPDEKRKENKKEIKKIIGVPREFLKEGVEEEILENFNLTLQKLKGNGYQIIDVSLPILKYSLAAYYILMPIEVSSNLGRYDGIRYGFSAEAETLNEAYIKNRSIGLGKEVKRRILLGTYILTSNTDNNYYDLALKIKNQIKDDMNDVFMKIDALITPTVPFLPFKIGEKTTNPISMYLSDIFSAPANLSGNPSLTIPSGISKDNLPFGVQLTAPFQREDILFTIGKEIEKLR